MASLLEPLCHQLLALIAHIKEENLMATQQVGCQLGYWCWWAALDSFNIHDRLTMALI